MPGSNQAIDDTATSSVSSVWLEAPSTPANTLPSTSTNTPPSTSVALTTTSEQLISDWLADPLTIYCRASLKRGHITGAEDFYTLDENGTRERMTKTLSNAVEIWPRHSACRLNFPAGNRLSHEERFSITTNRVGNVDIAIAPSIRTNDLFLKIRWEKQPQIGTHSLAELRARWINYQTESKGRQK